MEGWSQELSSCVQCQIVIWDAFTHWPQHTYRIWPTTARHTDTHTHTPTMSQTWRHCVTEASHLSFSLSLNESIKKPSPTVMWGVGGAFSVCLCPCLSSIVIYTHCMHTCRNRLSPLIPYLLTYSKTIKINTSHACEVSLTSLSSVYMQSRCAPTHAVASKLSLRNLWMNSLTQQLSRLVVSHCLIWGLKAMQCEGVGEQ